MGGNSQVDIGTRSPFEALQANTRCITKNSLLPLSMWRSAAFWFSPVLKHTHGSGSVLTVLLPKPWLIHILSRSQEKQPGGDHLGCQRQSADWEAEGDVHPPDWGPPGGAGFRHHCAKDSTVHGAEVAGQWMGGERKDYGPPGLHDWAEKIVWVDREGWDLWPGTTHDVHFFIELFSYMSHALC